MSPDAALFARLLQTPALPLTAERADALADVAGELDASLRDTTDALREVTAAIAALREGQRGAADRAAAAMARLELRLACQVRRTRAFVERAVPTPPA